MKPDSCSVTSLFSVCLRVSRRIHSMLSPEPEVCSYPAGFIFPFFPSEGILLDCHGFSNMMHSGLDISFASSLGTCRCILLSLMHSLVQLQVLWMFLNQIFCCNGWVFTAHLCLCLCDLGSFTGAFVSEAKINLRIQNQITFSRCLIILFEEFY